MGPPVFDGILEPPNILEFFADLDPLLHGKIPVLYLRAKIEK